MTHSTRDQRGWHVDDEGITFGVGVNKSATYDVVLNDQTVWSIVPSRDAERREGNLFLAWPEALRPHLTGWADVALRDYHTGTVAMDLRHVFRGDESVRLEVRNKAGHALIVDKFGKLKKPMSEQDATVKAEVLDASERILQVLRDEAGVPAFICYGTLLGAVRNGQVIGHDNDVDLAYLSEHTHPADIVRESFHVERALTRAGFQVRRGSGARLNVRLPVSDKTVRGIDVFTAAWVEDVLYIQSDTGFRLPRKTLLPLTTVTLEGRTFPAPADSERLLKATYGPGWRTPDPSFVYETPRWLARRLAGWFGGLSSQRKHWDEHFQRLPDLDGPLQPSDFAQWVATEHPSTRPLVDLGCGWGRDALWFAESQGRRVTAMEFSWGLRRARRQATQRGIDLELVRMNFNDTRESLAWGAMLSRRPEPADLYARLLLDSLAHEGRENVLRLASMALRRGGLLFLEIRDPGSHGKETERYVPMTEEELLEAVRAFGGRVVSSGRAADGATEEEGGSGEVVRLVASWSGAPR